MNKARKIDTEHCGTPNGRDGPFFRELRMRGAIRGLVFVAWGETSTYISHLLRRLARVAARVHWRNGQRMSRLMDTTQVGDDSAHRNACLKLNRPPQVERGVHIAAQRRYPKDAEGAQHRQLLHAQRMFDFREQEVFH